MMKNKKAWIRIVEAVIGILLLTSVLLVIYSRHQIRKESFDYIYELQKKVIEDIASDDALRNDVIAGNQESVQEFAKSNFPNNFEVRVKICDLEPDVVCEKPSDLPLDKQIFVEERIISATLAGNFSPKKIRLFVWEVF